MKKILLFTASLLVSLGMMAIGNNSGSSKANAIDFNWEDGHTHEASTSAKWYRVDLAPLYEEDNPALNLYLTNPDRSNSVYVEMHATVAGQVEDRTYTIAPHQYKSWSANAATLIRMKQTEVYLTLKSDGEIRLSAKVFEASDLDETCKDAKAFNWSGFTQTAGYATWWRVDLTDAKVTDKKDVRVIITNQGSSTLTLLAGQSLDCPSSGTTRRSIEVAAGESYIDTVPQSMIKSVAADELYVSLENDQPIRVQAELIDQPIVPAIPNGTPEELHVTDTLTITAGTHLYRISVAEMNAEKKYEPEFTFRNNGSTTATLVRKMAFELPAASAQGDKLTLAEGEETIEVIKKNTLDGLEGVDYVYVQIETDQDVDLYGRFKHVREGKACKTNIDFNWENGHTQDGKVTQWYAIDVTEAKRDVRDIIVHIENLSTYSNTVKASLAFSCPYIDLQEVSRTISAKDTQSRTIGYSTYAMMSDTIWLGLEADRQVHFWADTVAAETQEPDYACQEAILFNWEDGARQSAGDTVWYKLAMADVKDLQQRFPTVYVHNLGDATATVEGELSLDCPDIIANEKRTQTIAAKSTYSKELSRNLFEHISQDTIYLRVISTQDVSFEIRLTEEAEGTSCASAIRFNWELGNDQAANANLWYSVDLRKAMESNKDVELKLVNKDNAACTGSAWLAYTCPFTSQQDVNFSLAAKETKTKVLPHSTFETLTDSVIYIRLIGNTAMHFEARLIDPEPFDTIDCGTLTLQPLDWNTLYTQTVDTAWYILSAEQLHALDTLTTTPELYVHDLSGANNTVTAQIAYHCPITATMMTKSVTLSNGQELTKLIERGTIEQVSKKDTVLIRLIITGTIEFKAELVNPNTGNDRLHALEININEDYEQEANTTMWYKIITANWKADQTLHGKSLNIHTANHGGNADLRVEVFEDVSNDDLLEGHGHRTIEAGSSTSRNIPAYAVYGLADKELLIKITTNQRLTIGTATSDYQTAAEDGDQANAKLAVPNVDYEVPAGKSWFLICVPYIRNNYYLTDESNVVFSNPNDVAANVTVSATWQEPLTFDVPRRTRTIDPEDDYTKTFKELVDKGISRAGFSYSIAETKSDFLDSLLREFLTSDSLTAFVRVETDQPLKIRVNTPQNTGNGCFNAMLFDWEHGNVNPKGENTWFRVRLDSTLIPDTCDLRLHVENWSHAETQASATLYFDCNEEEIRSIDYTIKADEDRFKDIDRDMLASMGWADMLIYYNSDSTTRIWVELVPSKPRDSVVVEYTYQECDGVQFLDEFTGLTYNIDYSDPSTLHWRDSIEFLNDTAVAMWDSIIYITIVPMTDPQVYTFAEIDGQPNIHRGEPIDVSSLDTWLLGQLDDDFQTDTTLKQIDTLVWLYSTDGITFEPIPSTPTPTEAVILQYYIVTECAEDTLWSEFYYNTARDTLVVTACHEYLWALPQGNDSLYTETAFDSIPDIPLLNGCDSVIYLDLTITNSLFDSLEAIAKYGNRLLMVHKNNIDSITGWDIQEEHVTWYQVVTEGEDEQKGIGYYLTNEGEPLVGEYYALITIPTDDDCSLIGRTNTLVCEAPTGAPQLMPSLAQPEELIRVINLNPTEKTTIRVYTSDGVLLSSELISGEATYRMKAAHEPGYYLVEVRTEEGKTTLRYIVK